MDTMKDIRFIKNTIGSQRQQDHNETFFKWLLDAYDRCNKYLDNPEGYILLEKRILSDYEDFFPNLFFMQEIGENDITVANYKEKTSQKPQAAKSALVVKEGVDGQAKLVMQRGGSRAGAGRKKSGKESRTVKVALDPIVWMTIEGIKDIEEVKTMSEMLAILIERGLDNPAT